MINKKVVKEMKMAHYLLNLFIFPYSDITVPVKSLYPKFKYVICTICVISTGTFPYIRFVKKSNPVQFVIFTNSVGITPIKLFCHRLTNVTNPSLLQSITLKPLLAPTPQSHSVTLVKNSY